MTRHVSRLTSHVKSPVTSHVSRLTSKTRHVSRQQPLGPHSHSIVAGGLEEMS